MTAKITKIDPLKMSRNGKVGYIRVYFELQDGGWAITDLVPTFRNFKRWQGLLSRGPGATIDGVRLIGPAKVDADSEVTLWQDVLI